MARWIVPVVLIALVGCDEARDDRLVGRWEVDTSEQMAPIEEAINAGEKLGKGVSDAMRQYVDAHTVKMSLTFDGDGTYVQSATVSEEERRITGRWQVLSKVQSKTKVRLDPEGHDRSEIDIEFLDDDAIRMPGATGKILRFRRAHSSPAD